MAIQYTTGAQVKQAVEEIHEKLKAKGGLHSVFCVACGGSLSTCTRCIISFAARRKTSMHSRSTPMNLYMPPRPAQTRTRWWFACR